MNELLDRGIENQDPAVQIPTPSVADAACLERINESLDNLDRCCHDEQRLTLTVVMPVYNEQDTVRRIVERIQTVGLHDEIIIVDDCSTDGTATELDQITSDTVRVLRHSQNRGKGAAIRTALEHANGDLILIQDADLEYDPTDYPKLLAPLQSGEADVVYGSRFLENAEQDPSWLHRFGNRALTWASNVSTGQRLTDMETCYKVFRKNLLWNMQLQENRFGIEPELTAKFARRGARILEVPISYHSRGYEEGKKIGVSDGLNAIYCILRYAWCD